MLFVGLQPNVAAAAGNVSGSAWSSTIGWVNFGATNGDVQVTDSSVTGQAWNANYGWINLAPTQSGVKNNSTGQLSGYAWAANLGWINFSGVTIDSNGRFKGTATGDYSGNITFDCAQCDVSTTWRPVSSVSQNSGGSSYYIQMPGITQSEGTSSDTTEAALIAKLQVQIQGLTDQINALMAPRGSKAGASSVETLTENLRYGSTGSQVVLLQTILQQQGFFPTEITCNGTFGPTTLKAVEAFQIKNSIATSGSPGYGLVGPKTRAALNQLVE
jgi:hypothetical protein